MSEPEQDKPKAADPQSPENQPNPVPPPDGPADEPDTVEVITVDAPDPAAKHRVWAKVAVVLILVAAMLFVFVKSCAWGERGMQALTQAGRSIGQTAFSAYTDMRTVASRIWNQISTKGDTNYSYSIKFKSADMLDRYLLASNKNDVSETVRREKWFSKAEARIVGEASFEYFIALSKGIRIEATQMQDGRPIIYCIFSDLKLDTPVKFELRDIEYVKDGFLIDEKEMVDDYQINVLQKDLEMEGNSALKLAFAKEKARESLRTHFLRTWLPDLPWDRARVFIEFDSAKLEAPASQSFLIDAQEVEMKPETTAVPEK